MRSELNNSLTPVDYVDLGDFNGDGQVTNADLQGMILALTNGQGSIDSVPEPAAGGLLAFAGIMAGWLWTARRKMRGNFSADCYLLRFLSLLFFVTGNHDASLSIDFSNFGWRVYRR